MRFISIALTCLCFLMIAVPALAKDKEPVQMDMQAMMDTYKKLATPGEPHKQLASLAGSWTTKTKSWMEPGKPPMESTGSCEEKILLDGRYLQQECTGEMMGHRSPASACKGTTISPRSMWRRGWIPWAPASLSWMERPARMEKPSH